MEERGTPTYLCTSFRPDSSHTNCPRVWWYIWWFWTIPLLPATPLKPHLSPPLSPSHCWHRGSVQRYQTVWLEAVVQKEIVLSGYPWYLFKEGFGHTFSSRQPEFLTRHHQYFHPESLKDDTLLSSNYWGWRLEDLVGYTNVDSGTKNPW